MFQNLAWVQTVFFFILDLDSNSRAWLLGFSAWPGQQIFYHCCIWWLVCGVLVLVWHPHRSNLLSSPAGWPDSLPGQYTDRPPTSSQCPALVHGSLTALLKLIISLTFAAPLPYKAHTVFQRPVPSSELLPPVCPGGWDGTYGRASSSGEMWMQQLHGEFGTRPAHSVALQWLTKQWGVGCGVRTSSQALSAMMKQTIDLEPWKRSKSSFFWPPGIVTDGWVPGYPPNLSSSWALCSRHSLVQNSLLYKIFIGTSLVVQWLRLRLPRQGVWVWSLVGELRSHMFHSQETKT